MRHTNFSLRAGRFVRGACLLALIAAGNSALADWPQWRGAKQDGVITDFQPPDKWPAMLKQVWQVEVGAGHSSPIVVANRVCVMSRVEDKEIIRCLNLKSGEEIWSDQYATKPQLSSAVGKYGLSPRATPAAGQGRVYTLGAGGVLTAYDADKGTVLWRETFEEQFDPPFAEFGSAASPMVLGDTCIAMLGGKDRGMLAAFEGTSGRILWRVNNEGPGYAAPVVLNIAGNDQIVTQTQAHVIGVSPAGKQLWKIPFETQYRQNIVTAVSFNDCVIFSGFREPLMAWRVTGEHPEKLWENEQHPIYMSSPVMKGNFVFGMSEREAGHIFCVDARDGHTLWTSPGRVGENVSVQLAGDLLVLGSDRGSLTFARASGDKYDEVARYQLADGGTYAHPVLTGDLVIIKDQAHLTAYQLPK